MSVRRLALCSLSLISLFIVNSLWAQTQQPEIRTGHFPGKEGYLYLGSGSGNNGAGKAIFQGDIILDHVQQLPGSGAVGDSLGVAYPQYLWPKVGSVYQVPYTIDPSSGRSKQCQYRDRAVQQQFRGTDPVRPVYQPDRLREL